jgi:hypothetical protein
VRIIGNFEYTYIEMTQENAERLSQPQDSAESISNCITSWKFVGSTCEVFFSSLIYLIYTVSTFYNPHCPLLQIPVIALLDIGWSPVVPSIQYMARKLNWLTKTNTVCLTSLAAGEARCLGTLNSLTRPPQHRQPRILADKLKRVYIDSFIY